MSTISNENNQKLKKKNLKKILDFCGSRTRNCLCTTAKRSPPHHRFRYNSFLFDKYIELSHTLSDAKNRLLKIDKLSPNNLSWR